MVNSTPSVWRMPMMATEKKVLSILISTTARGKIERTWRIHARNRDWALLESWTKYKENNRNTPAYQGRKLEAGYA